MQSIPPTRANRPATNEQRTPDGETARAIDHAHEALVADGFELVPLVLRERRTGAIHSFVEGA